MVHQRPGRQHIPLPSTICRVCLQSSIHVDCLYGTDRPRSASGSHLSMMHALSQMPSHRPAQFPSFSSFPEKRALSERPCRRWGCGGRSSTRRLVMSGQYTPVVRRAAERFILFIMAFWALLTPYRMTRPGVLISYFVPSLPTVRSSGSKGNRRTGSEERSQRPHYISWSVIAHRRNAEPHGKAN